MPALPLLLLWGGMVLLVGGTGPGVGADCGCDGGEREERRALLYAVRWNGGKEGGGARDRKETGANFHGNFIATALVQQCSA